MYYKIIDEDGLRFGRALDVYTTGSTPIDDGGYDNEYSELGKLIHELKYEDRDPAACERIVDEIFQIALPSLKDLGFLKVSELTVVPMPSTSKREFDPVSHLAKKIADHFKLAYRDDILSKGSEVHAKRLERGREFADGDFSAIQFSEAPFDDDPYPMPLLIADDIYGEGRSLRACLRALKNSGHDERVYYLGMVYTRNHGLTRQP